MATSSTAVEMRLQGVDNASALLDAATQKLAKLQGQSSKASSKLRDAALGAGKALLFTGPLAALRTLRRSLLATAGAAAAIGYAIDRSAARLGALSDQAAQAGASADEITRLSLALREAGARGATVDALANAMARMAKTTGRSGMSGLRETLAEIAQLPDEAARVTAASNALGKSLGPQFAALVRQGPDVLLDSLDKITAAMPGVSDAVVAAGDDVADGMSTIREGIRNGWDSLLVSIGSSIASHFGEESFRALGLRVAAYVEYYASIAMQNLGPLWEHLKFWAANLPRIFTAGLRAIGDAIKEFIIDKLGWIGRRLKDLHDGIAMISGALGNAIEGDWEGAWETLNTLPVEKAAETIGDIMAEYVGPAFTGATEDAVKRLEEKLAGRNEAAKAIETISGAFSGVQDEADDLGKAGAAAAKKTADAWKSAGAIMAGSYEALRVSMQRTARAASSILSPASSSASTGSSAATGDLASLLAVQRDGWGMLRSSLSSLGVV